MLRLDGCRCPLAAGALSFLAWAITIPPLDAQDFPRVALNASNPAPNIDGAIAAALNGVAPYLDDDDRQGRILECLRPTFDVSLRDGSTHVFAYEQLIDGIPVVDSPIRVLAQIDANGRARVLYLHAATDDPNKANGDRSTMTISRERAVEEVLASEDFAGFRITRAAELVYLSGRRTPGLAQPTLCWRIGVWNGPRTQPLAWHVFVDAVRGGIIARRSVVFRDTVQGHLRAKMTPGTLPDTPNNPATPSDLARVLVMLTGGPITFTNVAGSFSLDLFGPYPADLTVRLTSPWFTVFDSVAPPLVETLSVSPSEIAELTLNETPDEYVTAQLNAFRHVHETREFYLERAPGLTALDVPLDGYVNLDDACNAFFLPDVLSVNFFRASGGCPNTAYASVVAHEYGHFILNQLGVPQDAFGEGFGDSVAILRFDDPIIAPDMYGAGAPLRDLVAADAQYPCFGEAHFCGQLLGGVWWSLRSEFGADLGPAIALDLTRQLFVDWSLITTGGESTNSAHPTTVLEVLVADDDDGDITNGTPHYGAIRRAFAAHNIGTPSVDFLSIQGPEPLPRILEPDVVNDFVVDIYDGVREAAENSGKLRYRVNGGAPIEVSMQPVGDGRGGSDRYLASLPALSCGARVELQVIASDLHGERTFEPSGFTLPSGHPAEWHTAFVGASYTIEFADDFETDLGWTVGSPSDPDTALDGRWERAITGATFHEGAPVHPPGGHRDGGYACVTGVAPSGAAGSAYDVDDGKTTLYSPVWDMSGPDVFHLSYWRWFATLPEYYYLPPDDAWRVEITNNGGVDWHVVDTVVPEQLESQGRWYQHQFRVADFVAPTSQVQLRFIVEDELFPTVTAAAIDDVLLTRVSCTVDARFRRGDVNRDGVVQIADVVSLLGALFEGMATANCNDAQDANDNGNLDISDVITLLDHLFVSGAPLPPPERCDVDGTEDLLTCEATTACP